MSNPILLLVLAAAAPQATADTLDVPGIAIAPHLDGVITEGEYGQPNVRWRTATGTVAGWIGHTSEWIYLTVVIPDSSVYWGDDLVMSLDADGSGGATPGAGDRQWYLRRTLDSSRVMTSAGGRWYPQGREPAALGAARSGDDWEVVAASTPTGWVIEARFHRSSITARDGGLPRMALRTYDDRPHGWASWPTPSSVPPQRVEQSPDLWTPLRIRD